MIMNITKDAIKSAAELYAEQFRLVPEDAGWFQQKVNDFTAGYNACLQNLQQTPCTTLLEELEHKLKAVRMLTFAMDEVTAARYDATESTLLSVIELIKERRPIA